MNVLIHHNRFDSGAGIKFYSTYIIPGRTVRDVILYRNEFRILDGDYTLRNGEESDGVYLIDNHYDSQDRRYIVNAGDSVFACPQAQDVQLVSYLYYASQAVPEELCTATELPEPSSHSTIVVALPLLALLARRRARRIGLAPPQGRQRVD